MSARRPGAGDATGALAHDAAAARRLQARLRRIEGQVRGLQKMVGAGRYCADVLDQMRSVQAALDAVGRQLLEGHLRHCAREALASGDARRSGAMVDELMALLARHGGR